MAYKVLSLKWRPQTFEDVVGQEHVTQTLINAFKQDRIAQGYIFTGPRGVGKTTTARILAMAMNAESGPTSKFDPKSEISQEISNGRSMDVVENDGFGASPSSDFCVVQPCRGLLISGKHTF